MKNKLVSRGVAAVAVLAAFAAGAVVAGTTMVSASPVSYKVVTVHKTVPPVHGVDIDVRCPAGLDPVGGGGHVGWGTWPNNQTNYAFIADSSIDPSGRGWQVTAVVQTSLHGPWKFTATAVCATP